MSGSSSWIIAVVYLGGVSVGAACLGTTIYMAGHERRRTMQLARIANRLGFRFRRQANSMQRAWFMRFPLFRSGRRRRIRNAMKGRFLNADVRVFDFSSAHGEGPIHRHTVAVYKLSERRIPTFCLWPHSIAAQRDEPMRRQERLIDMPGRPHFNALFEMRGVNPMTVRKLFHSRTLDFLERHPDLCIEGGGQWIAVYRYDYRTRPNELHDLFRVTGQAFRAFRYWKG